MVSLCFNQEHPWKLYIAFYTGKKGSLD